MLVLWGLVVAILTFLLAFEHLPLPQDVAPLRAMDFSQGKGTGPQHTVSLPDNWRSFPQRPLETADYSAEFDRPGAGERWGVYIPSYSGHIALKVNGVELTSGGFISGELSADQGAPFFAPISSSVLENKANTIQVTLQPGGKLTGFLSPVYVGPASLIRNSYNWHYLRAVALPILVGFWQLLLAALLFLLWYSRRNERAALYCGVLLVFSSIHAIPVFLPSSIDLTRAVAFLGYVTNFWMSVLGLLFIYALINKKLSIKEGYLLLLPTIATISYVIFPDNVFKYIDIVAVVPFSLIISGWIVYILLYSAIVEKRWDTIIILLSILGACTLAIHDTLIIMNVFPDSNFLHFRIVYILILPALSAVFFQRLIDSMNHVDDLVGTLEERIEQKELQLRETFAQQQVLEGRQALNEERQRIMRDVHDGLGGQLMSIIAMATSNDAKPTVIEGSARAALEDLRTMINSLGADEDITGILGTFRERAEQQLALQGVALEWNMIDIPPIEGLTPSATLNVLRIMQEAVTNAARHSGANKVTVGFSLLSAPQNMLRIDIEDDGHGFEQMETPGHGSKNMAQRARAIDGHIEIVSTARGTRVSLSIPTSFDHNARSTSI